MLDQLPLWTLFLLIGAFLYFLFTQGKDTDG